MLNVIKSIPALLGGIAAYLWGPWDALIMVLLAMVIIDYATGLINAAVHGEMSSRVGFIGIAKKALIFALVAVAALVDKLVPGTNSAVRAAVCVFYIANEGLSILENAGQLGLPLPELLKKALAKLKSTQSEAGNDQQE